MSVYILHLESPLGHARHYVGWAKQVNKRIEHHKHGTGARFTQVCVERGIDFTLARVFEGADRNFERKLKKTHSTKDYCPICMGDKAREYAPKKTCSHDSQIGDNYGLSCEDCGEVLAGYGYGGWFGNNIKPGIKCKHKFVDCGDGYKVCLYCEQESK